MSFWKINSLSLFLFLLVSIPSFGKTLFDHLNQSTPKSYIIYQNQNTYTALIYHSKNPSSFFLEEISIPKHLAKEIIGWKEWIQSGSQGASSHIMYELDLQTSSLIHGYSFTKNAFVYHQLDSLFLEQFLKLPLTLTPEHHRKKIGHLSSHDQDQDLRKLWAPPLIYEGTKIKSPLFAVYEGEWPKDSSELSGRKLQCYFDEAHVKFPFPYWIEVGDEYQHLNLKAQDSGYLDFLVYSMPKIPPEIETLSIDSKGLFISLIISEEFKDKLHFMLIDANPIERKSFLLQDGKMISSTPRKITIFFPLASYQSLISTKNRYQLLIFPENEPSLAIEWPHDLKFSL